MRVHRNAKLLPAQRELLVDRVRVLGSGRRRSSFPSAFVERGAPSRRGLAAPFPELRPGDGGLGQLVPRLEDAAADHGFALRNLPRSVRDNLAPNTPAIVSVFAGRIADRPRSDPAYEKMPGYPDGTAQGRASVGEPAGSA